MINRLERIDGVAYAMLAGGPVREIKVLVDQARLSGYGLTLGQLAQQLQSENLNLPGGTIQDGSREYVIRTTGEFRSLAEIRNVILLTPTGAPVRLEDIAVVKEWRIKAVLIPLKRAAEFGHCYPKRNRSQYGSSGS